METMNLLAVGIRGDDKIIIALNRPMTADEALNCAAYLVSMAEATGDATTTYDEMFSAIQK